MNGLFNDLKEKIENNFFKVTFAVFALMLLVFAAKIISDNFIPSVYSAKSLKSKATIEAEKIINEPGKIVNFTYGPYINLKKGDYNVTINYKADGDNEYAVTSEKGLKKIVSGVLPKNSTNVSVDINIPENIKDNGFEVITNYKGDGSFQVENIKISRKAFRMEDGLNLIGFFVFLGILLYSIKDKLPKDKKVFFALPVIYIMAIPFMLSSFVNFLVGYATIFFILIIYYKCNKLTDYKEVIKKIKVADIISMIITSFIIVSSVFLIIVQDTASEIGYVNKIGIENVLFYTVICFCAEFFLAIWRKNVCVNYRIMLFSVILFSIQVIYEVGQNFYTSAGIVFISLFLIYFIMQDDKAKLLDIKIKDITALFFLTLIFIGMAIFVAVNTIYKHKIYQTCTYDFGIFAQMFENMAKTGMPVTTCERGYELSHFYIHFSPIYYVILPFYYVFRSPEGLLGIQAVAVTSVIFPVYLIARKKNYSEVLSCLIAITAIFLPAFIAPAYFDFHENKFLAVLLLWFIYFMESKNKVGIGIFMLLSLMVKEDASIYVAIISLYYIITRKEYKIDFSVLGFTILYFISVMAFIQLNGKGLMEEHYDSYYLVGQNGYVKMFENIFQNPVYLIKNLFSDKKFIMILYQFVPFLFIPFITKNFKTLILIIPFVLINIMSNYDHQSEIIWQYTYGTATLILFMFILNLKERKLNMQYAICITAVFASLFMTYASRGSAFTDPVKKYYQNESLYNSRDSIIEKIPEDASVAADIYILPQLYKNKELYPYSNAFNINKNKVDYIIVMNTSEDYKKKIESTGLYRKAFNGIDMIAYELIK